MSEGCETGKVERGCETHAPTVWAAHKLRVVGAFSFCNTLLIILQQSVQEQVITEPIIKELLMVPIMLQPKNTKWSYSLIASFSVGLVVKCTCAGNQMCSCEQPCGCAQVYGCVLPIGEKGGISKWGSWCQDARYKVRSFLSCVECSCQAS